MGIDALAARIKMGPHRGRDSNRCHDEYEKKFDDGLFGGGGSADGFGCSSPGLNFG